MLAAPRHDGRSADKSISNVLAVKHFFFPFMVVRDNDEAEASVEGTRIGGVFHPRHEAPSSRMQF
jgi:hypothetical protein